MTTSTTNEIYGDKFIFRQQFAAKVAILSQIFQIIGINHRKLQ
ncbi:hypothetical protein N0Y54_05340 [Nostoc punctiforme UO1]